MWIHRYFEGITEISLPRERRKQITKKVTDQEGKQDQSLACIRLYLTSPVLPEVTFVASSLQQQVSMLTVVHLKRAKEMARKILKLKR